MEEQQRQRKYAAALETSLFLTAEGDDELALRVVRRALESLILAKETAPVEPDENRERIAAVEAELTRRYLALRGRLEKDGHPYRQTAVRAAIIAGIVSLSLILTSTIVVLQFQSLIRQPVETVMGLIRETVRAEIPRITSEVRDQIPSVSRKVQEEIPRMADALTKMVDEKWSRGIERQIESIVDERLPKILKNRLADPPEGGQAR